MKPSTIFGWILVGALCVAASAPLALWIAILVHALRASQFLGRWPRYDQPDPKALPPNLQTETLEAVAGVLAVVLFVTLAVIILRRVRWSIRVSATAGLVPICWSFWFLLARWDPLGIVEWYFD
jgi:hypothetical protein